MFVHVPQHCHCNGRCCCHGPQHWCNYCRRYTYSLHYHAWPQPQPLWCGPAIVSVTPSAPVIRDQRAIQALAG